MEEIQEVIGSGFSDDVKAQFDARAKVVSSKKRTTDELLYMNSNGAWAKLASSVNTLTEEDLQKLKENKAGEVGGCSDLAKYNVLFGGTAKQDSSNEHTILGGISTAKWHNPIDVKERGRTVEAWDTKTNLYHNYESLGFRPAPGIDSVSVESKNTYGTLREATVKITAWTLEDLEVIQALYLRPGYSMLLEWGHSMYIGNDEKLQKSGPSPYSTFFTSKNPRDIEKDLISKRKDAFSNYDAMFGYVKNFTWSFRQDGGYDCEVKLISKGSILESMSIMFDPEKRVPSKDGGEKDNNSRKSPFHKFFKDISIMRGGEFTREEGQSKGIWTKKQWLEKLGKDSTNYNNLQDFSGAWVDLDATVEGDDNNNRGQYIPLRTLLDFYNKYATVVDPTMNDQLDEGPYKLTKYYTGQSDTVPSQITEEANTKYERESKYITSQHHFSIDPIVCILPKILAETEIGDKRTAKAQFNSKGSDKLTIAYNNTPTKLDIGNINKLKESIGLEFLKHGKGDDDDILNIYLSVHFLSTVIERLARSTDKSDHSMFTFVSNILDRMNDVLGGVNDLDQFYDESEDMWYIVDRKKTPTNEGGRKVSELNLTGLKSTITKLDISSKISSQIASQISIAAQGGSSSYIKNVETLLTWNSGLLDRTNKMKSLTDEDILNQEQEVEDIKDEKITKQVRWAEQVREVFSQISQGKAGKWFSDIDYDQEKHQNLRPGHKQYCSKWVIDYKTITDNKTPPPGVIPVELSFTTVGIGGLKIGQAFRVKPGILPKRYTDNFGFIITGLSHNLSGNKWTTDIKTQFYSVVVPDKDTTGTKNKGEQDITAPEEVNDEVNDEVVNLGEGREWWTLVAICLAENFTGNYQGYADVAQSIYNRKLAGYYGGSVLANILGAGQYEPTFKNKGDWARIKDLDTATTAIVNYYKTRGITSSVSSIKKALSTCSETLQKDDYKTAAVSFVKTRTEFLASRPRSSQAVGIIERGPTNRNNAFFWRYEGKTELYEKNVVASAYTFELPNQQIT